MSKNGIIISAVFVALIAGFFVYLFAGNDYSKTKLPVIGNPGHVVGAFAFKDQEGKTVTEKDMNGKVSVVEYFFTTCTGICPKMNTNMNKVYKALKNTPGFQILSYTVNPAYDSVPVLEKYAEQFDADPAVWKFLTGPEEEVNHMAVNDYLLGGVDSSGVSDEFVHTQWWALIDKQRRIRGFYDGLKPAGISKLEQDVKTLLKEP